MSSEYSKAGIDYDVLDESKRAAIRNAEATSPLIAAHGGRVVEQSRGASAFVLELGGQHREIVVVELVDCLGVVRLELVLRDLVDPSAHDLAEKLAARLASDRLRHDADGFLWLDEAEGHREPLLP